MTTLIDTSLWIAMYRDRTGGLAKNVRDASGPDEPQFARFVAMEILQGCSSDAEWKLIENHLHDQCYVETTSRTWHGAARIYFELRSKGVTVRSSIDCCIAQLAIENNLTLLHNDRDFEKIAQVRPLKHLRIDAEKVAKP